MKRDLAFTNRPASVTNKKALRRPAPSLQQKELQCEEKQCDLALEEHTHPRTDGQRPSCALSVAFWGSRTPDRSGRKGSSSSSGPEKTPMDCSCGGGGGSGSSQPNSSPESDAPLPTAAAARDAGSCAAAPGPGPRAGSGRPAAANAARERSRVQTLRHAFLELQRTLPSVPPDTKLSKLDVLLLATTYIAHLTRSLQDEEDAPSDPGLGVLRGDGYLHPVKKWPMRSRLYIGATGQFLSHSVLEEKPNPGDASADSQP